jgi:hypothetical protein
MRVAEVIVPAVVMALLGGFRGALYLLCGGVVKVHRERRLHRFRRAVLRHQAYPEDPFSPEDLLRLRRLMSNESLTSRSFDS